MSICLDCVLFTLKDRPVKHNHYIPIFLHWLSMCFTHSGLTKKDLLRIKIDTETYTYLKEDYCFQGLKTIQPCQLLCLRFSPPETIEQGMMMKYIKVEYEQDVYMYCDIDILLLKSLHTLTDTMEHNTIYVHAENTDISNLNYGASFSKDELDTLPKHTPGLSAGKFFIYGKGLYSELMDSIHNICSKNTESLYTVEQPFYNKAMYTLEKSWYDVNTELLDNRVSFNGANVTDKTVFLDLAGIPGDGEFHLYKIIRFYILIQSKIL